MKQLPPLILQEKYYARIEAEIKRIFDALIYTPLLDILGMCINSIEGYEITNSGNALIDAISIGTVWYEDGQFKGRFNARISTAIKAIGGTFNIKARTWSLASERLPIDIRIATVRADGRYRELRRRMLASLDEMKPDDVDLISRSQGNYEKTISSMETDLQKTIPKAIDKITIEAKLTEAQRKIIAADWGDNLDLYIKGWMKENILKLREDIQPHVLAGGRALGLVKVIQENYGVGLRKAQFLARQETALLMSKFQETRYKDMGIKRYRWSTSHDVRVRHDHRELQGKVFSWDNPPVTDKRTGARNNPGQDYNCRCVAIPLVE